MKISKGPLAGIVQLANRYTVYYFSVYSIKICNDSIFPFANLCTTCGRPLPHVFIVTGSTSLRSTHLSETSVLFKVTLEVANNRFLAHIAACCPLKTAKMPQDQLKPGLVSVNLLINSNTNTFSITLFIIIFKWAILLT